MLPFLFEGGLDIGAAILDKIGLSPGNVPPEPDNLFWQMTNLCGELFFVAAIAYLLMARLASVPRWTLLVPLSQVLHARLQSVLREAQAQPSTLPPWNADLIGIFVMCLDALITHTGRVQSQEPPWLARAVPVLLADGHGEPLHGCRLPVHRPSRTHLRVGLPRRRQHGHAVIGHDVYSTRYSAARIDKIV